MKQNEFGPYGGQYLPDHILSAVKEVEVAFYQAIEDPTFMEEYHQMMHEYVGRPSLLYHAKRLSSFLGGATIYLKREDLNHTGAHKINNCIGQALLAKRMNKKRIIAETGAGQHGVATATVCAFFDMECVIYMGEEDMQRQRVNVDRMRMLGAEVKCVTQGTRTLKDAVDAAFDDFQQHLSNTYYLIGSAVGPHPYPTMVSYFQEIISREIEQQAFAQFGKDPDQIIACVGGGSNAIGAFKQFIPKSHVLLTGVEAAGKGLHTLEHAATLTLGKDGVFHGMYTTYIQDDQGVVLPVYSISPGLDYPGVGPEHAYLAKTKRVKYVSITDEEAVNAFFVLSRTEGIIPAIESSHALAYAMKEAMLHDSSYHIVVNLSGRGDKDTETLSKYL
ncbi:MAG: tryptophan synthase subunit beta [Candidatus Izemoplasmatales bacterium]|nr:tryptophan synthase subunit beta [Candidatus Izemoplasmatales bacterium]